MKLTDKKIAQAKPREKRYDICLNPDFKTLDCYLEKEK